MMHKDIKGIIGAINEEEKKHWWKIFYLQMRSECFFEISHRIFYNVFSNGCTNYKFSILSFPFKERQIENA